MVAQHVTAFKELNFLINLSISTDSMDSVQIFTLHQHRKMPALPVDISHLFKLLIIPHCDKQQDPRGYYERILQ